MQVLSSMQGPPPVAAPEAFVLDYSLFCSLFLKFYHLGGSVIIRSLYIAVDFSSY